MNDAAPPSSTIRRTILLLSTAALLCGCSSSSDRARTPEAGGERNGSAAETPNSPLAGTHWRLVEFQSMSDEVGTIRPHNPFACTLELRADGTAQWKLDCNRATGTWSAAPTGDGNSGTISFGVLAATKALCPPPSMGERVGNDAQHVRGFLLRDSRLYLSLMADAGIYVWQRESPVAFATRPDAALEDALRAAAPDYTAGMLAIGGTKARYAYGRVDLNDDGDDEVLAVLMGSIFCGSGGCDLVLLSRAGDGYAAVHRFPISRLPVLVADGKTMGWHDLVRRESGGGAEPSYVRHAFDGTRYVEAERLPGDTPPEGTWLLTGEYSYATGFPLEPRP